MDLPPPLTVDQLRNAVQAEKVDTVILALTDMQGRLQGKRLTARHLLGSVLEHGAEACNYLLAVDVEMNTVDGYAMSSWERGYGDFEMRPDLETLRMIPWHEGTALCLADLTWSGGEPVVASPRQILRAQLDRLAERGLQAFAGTELEFIVFKDTYEQAFSKGYRDLAPANQYNVDYSLLGGAGVEKLIRRIRNEMGQAGLAVESSKGECNDGQHEINFHYGPALRIADEHAIYKTGAKEIAAQEEMAITFMAKYDAREGSSCHIHLSLQRDGSPLFAADSEAFERFIAGQLACLRELTLLYAPNVNSYKRFAKGSFAPTAVAWGRDNRTCAVRVVGHGPALRLELRLPGADVNPYLALAAMIAAGLQLGLRRRDVLVLRGPARVPADDVHADRLRRLRAHLRGDARGGQGGCAGRLAVGLLVRRRRLVRAAGDHVRGHRRGRHQRGPRVLAGGVRDRDRRRVGEVLVVVIATIGQLFCGMACVTSCSRMMYAFSRDRAVPGWRLWTRLNHHRVPAYAVIGSCVAAALMTAPALVGDEAGAPYAFFAVVSICVIGLYIAYVLPVFLRWRMGDAFEPGPWTLGRHYRWVNPAAVIWVAICVIIFCLPFTPAAVPWREEFDIKYLNYAPVTVGGLLLIVGVWWGVRAKHTFKGPVRTVEFDEGAGVS